MLIGSLKGSPVTPSSNECSILPFLSFSIGHSETNEKDPGQPREISYFLFSHSSVVKFLVPQTQSMGISVYEIDQKYCVVE